VGGTLISPSRHILMLIANQSCLQKHPLAFFAGYDHNSKNTPPFFFFSATLAPQSTFNHISSFINVLNR
jgi:hypothetical protein